MAKEKVTDLYRDEPKYPSQRLVLELPLPPSVNHMYIFGRGNRKTLTKTAKDYIQTAQRIAIDKMFETGWKMDNPHVWFYMDLYFYFPDRIIRDSHNCLKLLTDVFEGLLYKNDYHILPRIQHVYYDKNKPRVIMQLAHVHHECFWTEE
jgi:Holliday junction resolvase RusA-like endonuclease